MKFQSVDNLILFNIFGRKKENFKSVDSSRNSLQTGKGYIKQKMAKVEVEVKAA